jgi:hypothetical protein
MSRRKAIRVLQGWMWEAFRASDPCHFDRWSRMRDMLAILSLSLLQCGAPSDPPSNGSDGADGGTVYCVLADGPQPTNTYWWAWDENAPAVDALHDPCPVGAECAVGDEAVKDGRLNPATRIGTCEP